MQINAKIDVTDALTALDKLQTGVQQSQDAALVVSVASVSRQMSQTLVNDNGLPISIASKRVRSQIKNGIGTVWVGTNPINAAQLQPMQNAGTGARAGNLFVDGGFVVSKVGSTKINPYIAKRTTKNRYPIIVVVKPIKPPAVDSQAAQDVYTDELNKHL